MKKQFFTGNSPYRLSVSKKVLGRGSFGRILRKIVYEGEIKAKDRKARKVAVRKFHCTHLTPLEFNEMVSKLRKAKVRVPETRAIQQDGKWYQVMKRFKSNGKSAFLSNKGAYKRFRSLTMNDRELLCAIARDYAEIYNQGYMTKHTDMENYLKTGKGKETHHFIDLHTIKKANNEEILGFMRHMYKDMLAINDLNARDLFINTFSKKLRSKKKLWSKAKRQIGEERQIYLLLSNRAMMRLH